MLVLSRKPQEGVTIAGGIEVTVISIRGNRVKLGISAPANVSVMRTELAAVEAVAGTRFV